MKRAYITITMVAIVVVILVGAGDLGLAATIQERLSPYLKANIDWRQVEGEQIKILVLKHSHTDLTQALMPEFEALTGIKVIWEFVPPKQVRQKSTLDLASGTGMYATHSADCMYYAMYFKNDWIEPLDKYINDPSLTDKEWYDVNDIFPLWREANTINGKLGGIPIQGLTSLVFYRDDLYKEYGLREPDTYKDFMENSRKLTNPPMYGVALRGMRGSGQNMWSFSMLFNAFGAKWFDEEMRPQVNSKEAIEALEYYCELLQKYAPPGVADWNWDSIVAAMQQEKIAQFLDNTSHAPKLQDPAKSRVVGKVGFARVPRGPAGRCTGLWNWGLPINKSISERKKIAVWLFIQWATSKETQYRTAFLTTPEYTVPSRFDVTRVSILNDPKFREIYGEKDFIDMFIASVEKDTRPDWRPRIPEYSEVLDIMAVAVQEALIGQRKPKEALAWANNEIEKVMARAGYYD